MGFFEGLLGNEYVLFFAIFLASVLVSKAIHYVLVTYVKRLTERTKTDVDDVLLEMIDPAVNIAIVIVGLFFATKALSVAQGQAFLVDGLFFSALVLLLASVSSKVLTFLMSKWFRVSKQFEKTPQLINKIVKLVIYLVALLMILGYFNIEITPIIATLGIGGLAIGLALQNTLSNLFAGLHILSDRPVRVGDFVEIASEKVSGHVEDIGWRSTRIRMLSNNMVVVPNSKLSESTITNYALPQQEMSHVVRCGVSYESDLDKVEKVVKSVGKKVQDHVEGAVRGFEPFVRYNEFGESNINFSAILRVKSATDRYLVEHEFIKALKKAFDREGIEISYPVRKVLAGKGYKGEK